MTLTLVTLPNGGMEPTIGPTLTHQRFSTSGPASSMTDLLPVTTTYDPPPVSWTSTDQPPSSGPTASGCETPTATNPEDSSYTLTVRMAVGGETRGGANDAAATWTDKLISATRFYDQSRFLEIKSKASFLAVPTRGGLMYHITVTYTLKNPYWHDTANDGSRRLFP